MNYSYEKLGVRLALTLTAITFLVACGGKNKDLDKHDSDHEHAESLGGRLLYSNTMADTLKLYDQTLEKSQRFSTTTVAAQANAGLILSNDGLAVAMLEGDEFSVISSGLEHLEGAHAHAHAVSISTAKPYADIKQVVATGEYFSTLTNTGSSQLVNSNGTETTQQWIDVVHPTLALGGGDFLKFTKDSTSINVDITVVDAQGGSGTDGLIFLRPNADGSMIKSLSCAEGIKQTAQTESFTMILCSDGSLRWLISGYEAPETHPQKGKTIHVTQRYPATADANNNEVRSAGANGEVVAGSAGFIKNISGVLAASYEDNVIAAWSEDQLWLINAHNDHPHKADLSKMRGVDFGNTIAVVANEHEALALLIDTGKIAIIRFEISNHSPVAVGASVQDTLVSANESYTATNSMLLAGGNEFFVIHKPTYALFEFDAHSAAEDYHLHSTQTNESLQSLHSAVFAHAKELHAEHAHDESEHGH